MYREALRWELGIRTIPFQAEVLLPIVFKEHLLSACYRADLVCFGGILVELKALRAVGGMEEAQVLSYLKASGLQLALLLNFGKPSLEYRRFVWSPRFPNSQRHSNPTRP